MKLNRWFILTLLFTAQITAPVMADIQLSEHETDFLQRHWSTTIPLQGKTPASYSKLEASLDPKSCGTCHDQQYRDWKETFHARAMGPGVLGQLIEMVDSDPKTAQMCWSCHTPLAEQQDKYFTTEGWKPNPVFDKKLQHQGLVCAACHVRNHQRFGPTRKNQPKQTGKISGNIPHNGFTAETAFSKSAFCKSCHQFNENDYTLNGKLIENTYNEWLESDYPAKGIQCQSCHMPNRRHLWRGIHDQEMTKQGVTIEVKTEQKNNSSGQTIYAAIRITNSGTGHYFPTYLTPKIEVLAFLMDANGNTDPSTLQQVMIGREATLDLSQEIYDTRIPPGKTLTITYNQPLTADNTHLRIVATVYPDHFYTRFYESMLSNRSAGRGTKTIEQALQESLESSFILFEKTINISTVKPDIALENKPSHTKLTKHNEQTPDWNDEQIQWFNYAEGLQQAKQKDKPILLLFYADWCPTCHTYKSIFADSRIVERAKTLVMIRVNVDRSPKIAERYVDDGEYVPRIYALSKKGEEITNIFSQRHYPKHFIAADATNEFLELMKAFAR